MKKQTSGRLLNVLIQMGEALQNSGAEIYRVEDTLNRIGYACGAEEMNVFVITSSIVITLKMPGEESLTQTRRLRNSGNNDFVKLEELNELSRQICKSKISLEEFETELQKIVSQKANEKMLLLGNILAAASFCIFYGGNLWDCLIAGIVGAGIWLLEKYMAPICLNQIAYQITASFISGLLICMITKVFPVLHMDKIMIGDIMLLIPGLMFTNAIRDVLLGDTISASMRLVEALLLAAALALGFFAAIWLVRGIV
mgnify:FL=1